MSRWREEATFTLGLPLTERWPTTEAGKVLLEWMQEHLRGVHDGRVDTELPWQFAAIEDEARTAVLALAERWEASAEILGERVLSGDPAATLASITVLRRCATDLRAALSSENRP